MKRIVVKIVVALLLTFIAVNMLLYWLLGAWFWPFMLGFGIGIISLMVFRIMIYRLNRRAELWELGLSEEAMFLKKYFHDAKAFKIIE